MSTFEIKPQDKKNLRQASRSAVEAFFKSLPNRQKNRTWISSRNRYRRTCTKQYKDDIDATPSQVNAQHLLAYVGASAPCHAIDGWSFLGRAIDSALRGDAYSAIHFGYYAELRAAMSLLGAEGIGIFDRPHSFIDNVGVVHRFPTSGNGLGTHAIVWPVLKFWTSLERAKDLIDVVVTPNSICLSSWLSIAGGMQSVRPLAARWLSSWGLDLATFDEDHDRRNLVSYRPSEFRKGHCDIKITTQFVEELWSLFEPSGGNRFPLIENLLLRKAWRQLGCGQPQDRRLQDLGLIKSEVDQWSRFLSATSNDPLPLALAAQTSPVENSLCHLQVIARATLLLFVASASARKLLSKASYTADNLAFWWKQHGAEHGLWPIGKPPDDVFGIWADVNLYRQISSQWRKNQTKTVSSLFEWRSENPLLPSSLGGLELVGIWSLIP